MKNILFITIYKNMISLECTLVCVCFTYEYVASLFNLRFMAISTLQLIRGQLLKGSASILPTQPRWMIDSVGRDES